MLLGVCSNDQLDVHSDHMLFFSYPLLINAPKTKRNFSTIDRKLNQTYGISPPPLIFLVSAPCPGHVTYKKLLIPYVGGHWQYH